MRKNVTLPMEFVSLSSKVDYIQQWTRDEWSSSCPQCGGVPHKDGTYPDRFRMWTNANGKNKVLGWCRHCNYLWFPDKERPISAEDFEKWRKEQIEREETRKREAERALELLRSQRIWEVYNANLDKYNFAVETIESWGIPRRFADAWKLGFIPDYTVHSKDGEYHSPAITIPVWQPDWEIGNIKVRVLNPRNGSDRYRKLYKTGIDSAFWTYPSLKTDTCLIVEGEKKAMVCSVYTDPSIQVVGLPTKTPSKSLLAEFAGFKKLFVCLDPDARDDGSLSNVVRELGKFKTFVTNLPDKVDDMIVKHALNINDVLKYAKKMEVV